MRILFLTTSYPVDNSDSRGIHIHRLAASLVAAGAEVRVVVPAGRNAGGDYWLEGVGVHPTNYWIPRFQALAEGLGGIVPNIKRRRVLILQIPLMLLALSIATFRRARWADVIHAHWVIPSAVLGVLFRRGRPLIVTSHGGDMELVSRSRIVKGVAKWSVKRVDQCLGVSEALTRQLTELGAGSGRYAFQPLGVETSAEAEPVACREAERWADSSDSFRALFVGSLIERKQPAVLIQALARLDREGVAVSLAFVGDGPLRSMLESEASAAGVTVVFAGDTPPRQVAAWLRGADALVLPSLSEGRPVVIMEAMAASLPVVATAIDGVRELVDNGKTGILVPPRAEAALASALAVLAGDRAMAEAMGRAGHEKLVAGGLLVDQVAASHLSLYSMLVKGRRDGG